MITMKRYLILFMCLMMLNGCKTTSESESDTKIVGSLGKVAQNVIGLSVLVIPTVVMGALPIGWANLNDEYTKFYTEKQLAEIFIESTEKEHPRIEKRQLDQEIQNEQLTIKIVKEDNQHFALLAMGDGTVVQKFPVQDKDLVGYRRFYQAAQGKETTRISLNWAKNMGQFEGDFAYPYVLLRKKGENKVEYAMFAKGYQQLAGNKPHRLSTGVYNVETQAIENFKVYKHPFNPVWVYSLISGTITFIGISWFAASIEEYIELEKKRRQLGYP